MKINQFIYDGTLIKSRFLYQFFRDSVPVTGGIVSFVAPMDVTTNLIDLEDSLQNDFIKSDSAINFCWEIPNMCPLGAVAFQRLLCVGVGNILHKYLDEANIHVNGDDILVTQSHGEATEKTTFKKASVSITYSKDNVALGHLGININAGEQAPGFAFSTNLSKEQVESFIKDVEELFTSTLQSLLVATTKVIV